MEDVRMLVQEEGRAARNLIAFHVDVNSPTSGKGANRKPPSSPRLASEARMTKRSVTTTKTSPRVRSSSLGRDKKSELQALREARYWAFLFGNLERAIDDIYKTCEVDESVSECKEVIYALEIHVREFHNLIEWFRVKQEYENTPPPQRPTSTAWEIRKSSPGKIFKFMSLKMDKTNKTEKPSPAKKQLNFSSDVKVSSAAENSKSTVPDTEQIFSNQYGLSFGDINLKEHITAAGIEIKDNSMKSSTITENKIVNEDKEGLLSEEKDTSKTETSAVVLSSSNHQSSQTDSISSQNVKNPLKPFFCTSTVQKRPPPLTKIVSSTGGKSIGTTVSGSNARKSVPVSPTSTSAPRTIPGRNVAAVTFVPKKPVEQQYQTKNNLAAPKTVQYTNKVSKVHCQSGGNQEIDLKQDSNKQSEEKTGCEKEPDSSAASEKPPKLLVFQDSIEEETDKNFQEQLTQTSSSESVNICENDEKTQKSVNNTTSSSFINSQTDSSKTVGTLQETKTTTQNIVEEKPKIIKRNVIKVDKCVMTDLPYVPKQSANKVTSLVRNKTVPSFLQKSSEAINSLDSSVKNNSAMNASNAIHAVKKQLSIPEAASDKLAYSLVSKVTRSLSAVETKQKIPPSIKPLVTSKYPTLEKQAMETSALSVLKKQSSIQETTNAKPAYSSVSKVFRSNTALELRSKTSAMKVNATSRYQQQEKHDAENSLKKQSKMSEVANKSAVNVPSTKLFRSNTAIEFRNAKSKYSSQINQRFLLQKERSRDEKTPTSNSSTSSLCASEPGLKKRNSVDADGWETVKGRSRWRLTQSSSNIKARTMNASSRFCLPSPATSLPALALASDEPEEESRPAKLHKDKQNLEIARANKTAAKKTKNNINLDRPVSKSKEDLSEKKMKPSVDRKRYSLMRLRNAELKNSSIKEEKTDQDNKIDKYIDILSSEDERINEEEIRKSMELDEEEKMLTKEIQDLEKAEIDVDTETDEAETDGDGEMTKDLESDEDRITALKASLENNDCHNLSWVDQIETLEKLEQLMAQDTSIKGVPWEERMTTLEQLEELVARHPGRALELHQKLSSPSRRRPLPDTIQRHRARQENAQLKRNKLLQDKSAKLRDLLKKVEEVKEAQEQLRADRKKRLADKLKRAEENRKLHISSIKRKAHDEEEKLREIAFINQLEAQNKRHDLKTLEQEQQDRYQGILDERQRRQEEKAAKEAAVEERKRILEAERQEKLEKMQEKRRKREERIGREQQEKEKERLEMAREKARDREERLQALKAAEQATVEELQKKIQQKQTESARRHEENIEHIRQRALESGALRGAGDDEAPTLTPYDTYKLCRVCNILIVSEVYLLSHLRGKAHQEAVKDLDQSEIVIIDAPSDISDAKLAQDRERQKALRKRCKKIRTRMMQRGEEYLTKLSTVPVKKLDSPNKGRLFKCLRDVDKLHTSQGIGQWPNNSITLLERNLAEINRILEKQNALDQKVFRDLNGFTTISNILNLALDIPKNMSPYLPAKCFLTTCTVYTLACTNNPENSRFVFFSNKISLVLDLLLNQLNILITDDYKTSNKSSTNLPSDPVAGALMKLFALILKFSQDDVTGDVPDMTPRLQDIISYTVSVGVVDKLALYCGSVRDPLDNNPQAATFLLNAIQLLTILTNTNCGVVKGDPTQLVATLKVTELVGGVSMLYGMLLHQGTQSRDPATPPAVLPLHTVTVTRYTLHLLKAVAQLDLNMFQSVLGAEGMSLQLRHIASHLLWYCSYNAEKELLHQVIQVVGYFAVNHFDNQMILQSGHMPTVLQQLCNLPFEYFSDPTLSSHLFPTLLACCHGNADNRAILEQELSYQLLEDFKTSEVASKNPLICLLK